jgi:PKD repeat protein
MKKFVVSALLCAGLVTLGLSGSANAVPVTVSFTVDPSSPVAGESAQFTYTGTASGPLEFVYSFGDTFQAIAEDPTHTFHVGGIYDVFLTVIDDANGDLVGTANMEVDVSDVSPTPLPAALPLFAGGLGMVGFIARRKKRNALAAA